MSVTTWSLTDKSVNYILSDNDLTATTNAGIGSIRATNGKTTGKWYWEIKVNDNRHLYIGIANKDSTLSRFIGEDIYSISYKQSNGNKLFGGETSYGTTLITGNVLGVALDLDNDTIKFFKNGVDLGVAFSSGIKALGEVFPALGNGSASGVVGGSGTANFGITDFTYDIPDGYLPYDTIPSVKHLIKSSNKIQTLLDGGWNDTGIIGVPTKLDFETYGMDDLSIIPKEKINELEKPYSVLTWTDDTDVTKATLDYTYDKYKPKLLEIETDPFIPLQKFKDTATVLTWTDSPEIPTLSHNIKSSAIGKYLLSIDNITYHSFKDGVWNVVNEVDIIDQGMSKTELESLSQADLILLTGDDIYTKSLQVVCGIYDEFPDSPLSIRKVTIVYTDNQAPLILNPEISNDTIHNEYTTITGTFRDLEGDSMEYRVLIKKHGEQEFYVADDWVEVVNNFKFTRAYNKPYFTLGENVIRVEAKDSRGALSSWEVNLVLTNQIPLINYTYNAFGFSGVISDPDSDKVSIQVTLNNDIVLPYTELMTTPRSFKYEWDNKLVSINGLNEVKIELKDEFDGYVSEEFMFIGEYKNILFEDEDGFYYSTDTGIPIKILDKGMLTTGDLTEPVKIAVKNNTNYTLGHISLRTEPQNYKPDNIKVYLSEDQSPTTHKETLDLVTPLIHGQSKDVYVYVEVKEGNGMPVNNIKLIADGKLLLD